MGVPVSPIRSSSIHNKWSGRACSAASVARSDRMCPIYMSCSSSTMSATPIGSQSPHAARSDVGVSLRCKRDFLHMFWRSPRGSSQPKRRIMSANRGGVTRQIAVCRALFRALETFRALGIEFVSFSEQMDTSTPAGKMVFTVLGAVAELERSLIVERVKSRPAEREGQRKTARSPEASRGSSEDGGTSRARHRLEADRCGNGHRGRNALPTRQRGFQNSENGFLNLVRMPSKRILQPAWRQDGF